MAIFRLDIQPLARSAGRSATSAAAYRAGERIRDERTGKTYDHAKRTDVLAKEIVLPSALRGSQPAWSRDRTTLWNLAEAAERRSNSRVAREYQVALPSELSAEQRLDLTRKFSRELADRYNVVVDTTIHAPREGGDPRAYHAHLLTTTREATAQGLGAKSSMEIGNNERLRRGLRTGSDEFKAVRARWAELTNEALRAANINARVDHRSLAAQGIDREPGPSIPHRFFAMERQGIRTTVATQIRENYRRRMEARATRELESQNTPRRGVSLESIQREAAQAWRLYRDRQRSLSAGDREKDASRGRALEKAPDHDHSL